MATDEEALLLHDRAARGESLTVEETARLEAWYAAQDAAEARELSSVHVEPVEDLRAEVHALVAELRATAGSA